MCICCKPGEEGEIIGTIRSDDRGGPENFEVGSTEITTYIVSSRLGVKMFLKFG